MENKNFENLESLLDLIAPQGEGIVARSKNFRFILKCLAIGMGAQAVSSELKENFSEEIERQHIRNYWERYLDGDTIFEKAKALFSGNSIDNVTVQEISEYEWLKELMTRSRQNLSTKENEELKEEIANAVKLIDLKRKLKEEAAEERQKLIVTGHAELDDTLLVIAATGGCVIDGKFSWDTFEAKVEDSLLNGELARILKERNSGKSL